MRQYIPVSIVCQVDRDKNTGEDLTQWPQRWERSVRGEERPKSHAQPRRIGHPQRNPRRRRKAVPTQSGNDIRAEEGSAELRDGEVEGVDFLGAGVAHKDGSA